MALSDPVRLNPSLQENSHLNTHHRRGHYILNWLRELLLNGDVVASKNIINLI